MILKQIKFSENESNVLVRGITSSKVKSGKEKVAHQPVNNRIKCNYNSAVTDRKIIFSVLFTPFCKSTSEVNILSILHSIYISCVADLIFILGSVLEKNDADREPQVTAGVV